MPVEMDEHEKTRTKERLAAFRRSVRSLVEEGLSKATPEHELRQAIGKLHRETESDLADILGSERAETFGVEAESDPRVTKYVLGAVGR